MIGQSPRGRRLAAKRAWAMDTLRVHVEGDGICVACASSYGSAKPWPCLPAQVARFYTISPPAPDDPDPPAGKGPQEAPSPGDVQDSDLDDLLVRVAAGDSAAFATLYTHTAPRAFGLALRVVRDRARAEDLTCAAYLRMWRTAAAFDADLGTGLSWILVTVHRVAVEHVRSVGRGPVDGPPAGPVADSPAGTPGAELTARLSPPERRALELSYFDGHTHTEVAGLLGLPVGTASVRIRDGLIQVRDATGESGGPPVTP
jgi:RNA polymerase sigma-70 factor, ECF subfamily